MQQIASNIARWLWRRFRRLPEILQLCIAMACTGSIAMSVFVGDVGLAAMGTAIGVNGPLLGAIGGVLSVVVPWGAGIVYRTKREQRRNSMGSGSMDQ